jgi:fluoroquinolone transport system ATP-binding protein
MRMDESVIAVNELRYTYPGRDRPAIDGMTFEVARGEVFGFLGPSGAGKTTTQRAVIGLIEGWTGSIDVLGRPLAGWGRELYDRIGVAF